MPSEDEPVFHTLTGRQQLTRRPILVPALFVLALALAYAIPFSAVPWPFGDVYEVLLKADSLNWFDTFKRAFREGVEYRPGFMIAVKVLYETVGLHLWFYKLLVLIQFVLLLWIFISALRPTSTARAAAALIAVCCVAGLHTSRILFSFFPLNHHSLTILLVLLVATLALNGSSAVLDWLVPLIALAAFFLIEFGLLIPPVLTVLWLVKARGATTRALVGVWAALVLYVAIRFGIGIQDELGLAHAETGIGFDMMEMRDIEQTFQHAPVLFWAYNIVANVLSVLISEPRNGIYLFVRSLIRDTAGLTIWFRVLSSAATTAFIAWSLWRRPLDTRDRQLAALGLSLLAFGGGLGMLYSRDRIGLPVGIGYSMLLYLAVARSFEQPARQAIVRRMSAVALVLISAAWVIRDAEAWFQLRDTAWERRVEWTERFVELGGVKKPQTELLERLKSAAMRGTVADPRADPPVTFVLIERRVDPLRD